MNDAKHDLSRRNFIKTTAAAGRRGGRHVRRAGSRPSLWGQRAHPHRVYRARRTRFWGPCEDAGQAAGESANVDLTAVSDVYSVQQEKVVDFILSKTGIKATRYENYEDLLADKNVDAVCIATPDHWHAKQTIDALKAGKHVYCEKPMTHSIDEALEVVKTWKASGKVMQVGVQSTSLLTWDKAREAIQEGLIGKVLQLQTAYSRTPTSGSGVTMC